MENLYFETTDYYTVLNKQSEIDPEYGDKWDENFDYSVNSAFVDHHSAFNARMIVAKSSKWTSEWEEENGLYEHTNIVTHHHIAELLDKNKPAMIWVAIGDSTEHHLEWNCYEWDVESQKWCVTSVNEDDFDHLFNMEKHNSSKWREWLDLSRS